MTANGMSPNVATDLLSCEGDGIPCSGENRETTRVDPWEDLINVNCNQLQPLNEHRTVGHITGVYLIVNTANRKIYVGQSVDIGRRLQQHIYYAERGDRHALPQAMAKYGVPVFRFTVLERCRSAELHDAEERWISTLHARDDAIGYNTLPHHGIGHFDRRGEHHPNHHLTLDDVKTIRARRAAGESRGSVYADYADVITPTGFAHVWLYETWKDGFAAPAKRGRAPANEAVICAVREARVAGERYAVVAKRYPTISKRAFDHMWYGTAYKHVLPDVTALPKPRARYGMEKYVAAFVRLMADGYTWSAVKRMYVGKTLSLNAFRRYWKAAKAQTENR